MASQDRMDSEGSSDSVESSQNLNETVAKIFKEIFDDNIQRLSEPLQDINENKFGNVWCSEKEKHVKTMRHARLFLSAVVDQFHAHYDSVSKEIAERSACDVFQKYIIQRLSGVVEKVDMLQSSFEETKEEFFRRISEIKEKHEKKEERETASKSDVDGVILKSKLMDPVHINHALLCCRVAYECKVPEKPQQCLDTFNDKHWLSELVVSYQSHTVPRYVMARCGNVLYVAFRGLESTVTTIATGCVKTNTSWRGQTNSRHSTGGAVASLVVILLLERLKGLPPSYIQSAIKCITFGMTPFGDENLKKFVESIPAMKEWFCHIVKHDDIIPKLFGSNLTEVQEKLIGLVVGLVSVPAKIIAKAVLPTSVTILWNLFMQYVPGYKKAEALPLFDIFGEYYIVNPGKEPKFIKCAGDAANKELLLQPQHISESYKNYLVNHRIERYDNDVRQCLCLVDEYPEELKSLTCNETEKPKDIFPDIDKVHFETFGDEVVAKVNGKDMWFVHEVTFRGLEPLSSSREKVLLKKTKAKVENYHVDISKNTESVVEINMGSIHISSFDTVNVRVKTHFQNSRCIKPKNVEARKTPHEVSKRQEQLAKLSPSKVIELAHLSALLEGRISSANEKGDRDLHSRRYANVQEFFEGVISVVPAESLFHAMAVSEPSTVLQCCQLLLAKKKLFEIKDSSKFLRDCMELAVRSIASLRLRLRFRESSQFTLDMESSYSASNIASMDKVRDYLRRFKVSPLQRADEFIRHCLKDHTKSPKGTLCGLNLEEVYTASAKEEVSSLTIEHPLTLVKKGKDELNALRKNMSSKTRSAEKANSEMLQKLNDLRVNFQTCSALLGSFMEAQVHVPLEWQGDNSAQKIATAAESGGLTVWMMLILPVSYLKKFISRVMTGHRKLLVGAYSFMRSLHDGSSRPNYSAALFCYGDSNYSGKLEFLMTSMKRSSSSNTSFIAYSLERQLVIECAKRNINYETSLETILEHWDENFPDEALTMVEEDYRPMIARWIKWSLMIHQLRESLAEQTAVGIIGLVNSGKSKFVRSMFGIETVSGTVAEKRTTVPFIYSLDGKIEGLDVIDFPGVDDNDKSIAELAKLLLSLTRIVVFVVDYRRVHSDAAAQWMKILEDEKVPVLICLSFADKLFSEHMIDGKYPEKSKVKDQLEKQLSKIKEQVGQPKTSKRDFKFVVFDFDNDSRLNNKEGKQRLVQAGLHDEKKVGEWIAEKLRDNKDVKLADKLVTFIFEKNSSTLHFDENEGARHQIKHGPQPAAQKLSKSKSEPVQKKDASPRTGTKKQRRSLQSSKDQAMCSKDIPNEGAGHQIKHGPQPAAQKRSKSKSEPVQKKDASSRTGTKKQRRSLQSSEDQAMC